jgi:hypothetical protein
MFLGAAKCSFIERPGTPPSLKGQEPSRFQKERSTQCISMFDDSSNKTRNSLDKLSGHGIMYSGWATLTSDR